jgi:hypothetical protein
MMRKRAITLLGMALLVAASGFATRAWASDRQPTVDQQHCDDGGGWVDPAAGTCEFEAP